MFSLNTECSTLYTECSTLYTEWHSVSLPVYRLPASCSMIQCMLAARQAASYSLPCCMFLCRHVLHVVLLHVLHTSSTCLRVVRVVRATTEYRGEAEQATHEMLGLRWSAYGEECSWGARGTTCTSSFVPHLLKRLLCSENR